jgi:2-methylaconitate cis-trans-isomerase PrpF
MSEPIRCTILRGGTSKGVYLREADLPADPAARERTILSIFGSPDRRQIDGLGGADPLTSKVCIVGPPPEGDPRAEGAHLSYTFGQVEIDEPVVDCRSLCGNLTSGVGAFAIWENMVRPVSPMTTVRIWNTNLQSMLYCEVPVEGGRPQERGDYTIPGVPGNGAKIQVDFTETAGQSVGALLPTGNPMDRLEVVGLGSISASMIDIGNPHVFIRAKDIGLKGTETADQIDADKDLTGLLERIRSHAAYTMGMISNSAHGKQESPAAPIIAMISPPQDYEAPLSERTVKAEESDFLSRLMFMQQMHKTYAGTSTVCTGIASKIPGTIVHEACREEAQTRMEVRIGHPAGVIETESVVELNGNDYNVKRATLGRTARRIMEGTVYIK